MVIILTKILLNLQFIFTLICEKVGGVNKEKLATDYLLLQ